MKIPKIKFMAAMVFITILLDVIPFSGFIDYGDISITTMHIPAIVTAVVLGPGYGAIIGALFGVTSLLHAISREATPMDVLFINPFVSVLPRICVAVVSGYLYALLKRLTAKPFSPVFVMITGIAGTLTNTLLVLLALYQTSPNQMMHLFGLSGSENIVFSMWESLKINICIEIFLGAVISVLAVYLVQRISDRLYEKQSEICGSF